MTDFNYNAIKDEEMYIRDTFKVADRNVEVSAVTTAGSKDKPNEDSFALRMDGDCMWVAVFDGTTSMKAIAAIDGSGARFSSHFLKDMFYRTDLSTPESVLTRLNKGLLEKSKSMGGDLSDTHSLPASMATIVKLDFSTRMISLAHIGDTYAVQYSRDGKSNVITDDRNQAFDDEMFDLLKKIAKERNISIKDARKDDRVDNALIEMFIERNNNPNGKGSGIVNGDPNMERYIYTNSFSMEGVAALLVASDGLEIQGYSLDDLDYQMNISNIIDNGGMEELIKVKRESEDSDPDWENVRYKHSDDATGVFIKLKS